MKILMVAPTPYFSDRGCHVRIFEEAKALRVLGHDVSICTYHLGRDLGGIPTYRTIRIPWYSKQTAGPSWHKPYLDILLFFKSWQVARKLQPDILHAHLHEGAFIAFFLKKLLKIPMVFDCQGSLVGELVDHHFIRNGSLLYRAFCFLEKQINQWPDLIITSSTRLADLLRNQFKLDAAKVISLCDGVDVATFRPGLAVESLRRQLGLPADRPIVVYLGAMSDYQGLDILLEVIRHLEGRIALHFLIMGYPEDAYVIKAAQLGITHRVTFTGRIDYLLAPEYLCLGDMAVSPKLSLTEANGKLLNYLACGLPTIAFDVLVNREILGEAGVYAKLDSVDDLARKILLVAEDLVLREGLSSAARTRAVDVFSWNRIGRRMTDLYQKQVLKAASRI
jgi:glycosyltransferase involved in cell wall biosynthesis